MGDNERWKGFSEAEVLSRIEAEYGKEAAAVAARFVDPDRELPWKHRHNRRDTKVAGRRAKARKAIPASRSNEPGWRERNDLGPLPRSGAPRPPKRAPRDLEDREGES